MTYRDMDGMNYVFMSAYDGTMRVQPIEREMEMTRRLDLRDVHGVYIIRELIRAAKDRPQGSFVRYHYYIPSVHDVQEKLAYVVGLPEPVHVCCTADVIARQGVLEEGVSFIQKPFSMKELAKKIREALG